MIRVIHACCVLHNIANVTDLEFLEAPINDEYPDIEAQGRYIGDELIRERDENGKQNRDRICHQLNLIN